MDFEALEAEDLAGAWDTVDATVITGAIMIGFVTVDVDTRVVRLRVLTGVSVEVFVTANDTAVDTEGKDENVIDEGVVKETAVFKEPLSNVVIFDVSSFVKLPLLDVGVPTLDVAAEEVEVVSRFFSVVSLAVDSICSCNFSTFTTGLETDWLLLVFDMDDDGATLLPAFTVFTGLIFILNP